MPMSRSPHGERGLKFVDNPAIKSLRASLPTRGAWIEIAFLPFPLGGGVVAPHTGERGLKFCINGNLRHFRQSRSPHGERGLKSSRFRGVAAAVKSLPTRGAGIEILRLSNVIPKTVVTPHAGVGIEKWRHTPPFWSTGHRPPRGRELKLRLFRPDSYSRSVAPPTGSVN